MAREDLDDVEYESLLVLDILILFTIWQAIERTLVLSECHRRSASPWAS